MALEYAIIDEALEKEISADPAGYVFFERAAPCRFNVLTLDTTRKFPKTIVAADLETFDAKKRKMVFMEDPECDIMVSRIVRHQAFLYPEDDRDFDLLRVLQCTEIKTENDVFHWDAPGLWYNKESEITNFWSRSNK